ncbi:MAG: phenylalanine--tRNA ligase subunit alpha [Actinobacteria bacterium]|nr:phenylalanine--tRNA ligase subunit alpha [Actinomycetota bacterium]MCL6105031.1 phenylalanine--tRNA ligase subunit alpha [Actinomycetota bacterium]
MTFDISNIEQQSQSLIQEAEGLISQANSMDELKQTKQDLMGDKSPLSQMHRKIGTLEPEQRKQIGRLLNEVKERIDGLVSKRREELEAQESLGQRQESQMDLTEVLLFSTSATAALGYLTRGHMHLVTQTQIELEDTFVGMGFFVAEGPEVETDWYNFEALNMPPDHPARGMWDTFYLNLGAPESILLRTHTSPVQIHLMESAVQGEDGLPIYAVMPGRCYRRDTPDARHIPVFHQIEGLVVDKGITFADLAGTIEAFTTAYFGSSIHSRLRPSYFPFTEPSAEFEITCTICEGVGCRTCSNTGWIELGGCGMVNPRVFDAVGIDSLVWSGFAFGFGIDRCAQMRYQIADMRQMLENDVRFLYQF